MTDPRLEANKAVVRRFFAELEAGRVEDAVALFVPDGTFWSPSQRKTSSMAEFSRALHWVNSILVEPMRYELGPITAEDDRVCVIAESFATMKNGKRYNNVYHFYFEVANGLIRVGREYNDTAHVWETLRAGSN